MHFSSMADLMNKVGSYQILLNEFDETTNSSRTNVSYISGTLKPRYGPNRHKTVGAIYSHLDPYYTRQQPMYHNDFSCDNEEEVAAVEIARLARRTDSINPISKRCKGLKHLQPTNGYSWESAGLRRSPVRHKWAEPRVDYSSAEGKSTGHRWDFSDDDPSPRHRPRLV